MSVPKVLLVGGGLTSAVVAHMVRLNGLKLELVVWDKARRPGGRLTSHRGPRDSQVDLGAQFISTSRRHRQTRHQESFYSDLVSSGILRPLIPGMVENEQFYEDQLEEELEPVALDDKLWEVSPSRSSHQINLLRTTNYVAPQGSESVVNHLWDNCGVIVKTNHCLKNLDLIGNQWRATTENSEVSEDFDSVITTLPVPQLLGETPAPEGSIQGNFLDFLTEDPALSEKLYSIKYNSVFCLGVFYDEKVELGFNWSAKYFPSDPYIRYVAVDSLKRGGEKCESPTTLVVQSQVRYAKQNLARSKEDMAAPLLKHLKRILPYLPQPSSVHCHKWRYSQTSRPYPSVPGCVTLGSCSSGPLVAAGDSFTHSNVDGCLASAEAVFRTLRDIYVKS